MKVYESIESRPRKFTVHSTLPDASTQRDGMRRDPMSPNVWWLSHNETRNVAWQSANVVFFSFCWVHARLTTLDCAIDKGYSVRPSASLSVTLMIHAKTVQGIEIRCTPYDRVMFLDHSRQILQSWV